MVKSRHTGLSLVSWGPSMDFNTVVMGCTWAHTMVWGATISWMSIFFCTWDVLLGPSPLRDLA